MKGIFSILIILCVFSGNAQNSNKKRVLVIPPSRFEFVSKFKLEEIAAKNNIKPTEVFLTYEKALLSSFETYNDDNFEFIPIDANGIKAFKNLIHYKPGKFNGKHYNAVDLSRFSEKQFTQLLAQYQCDFIIFITWYNIQKHSFSRSGIKRVKYAAHLLDFDVYNLFKQQVVGMAKVQAEAPEPNDLQASFSLLRVKEVKVAYANFIEKVVEQLNKPIEIK
ncbi:MAG: hypothetical protein ACPGSO_08395 [Vicingaceae bacterium]